MAAKACGYVCPRRDKWFSEESYGLSGTMERKSGTWSRPRLLKRLSYDLGASLLALAEGKIYRSSGTGQEAFFCCMCCDVGAARTVGAPVAEFFHKPLDTVV